MNVATSQASRLSLRPLLLCLSLFAATNNYAQPPAACECLWHGPFTQTFSRADTVVAGEVIARKGNSFDLSVTDRLADPQKQVPGYVSSVRIWGDNGKLCRPDVSMFSPGSRWVLALRRIETVPEGGFNPATPSISFGRKNDFFLSSCGAYWLQIQGNVVTGNLLSEQRWRWSDDQHQPVALSQLKRFIAGEISAEALSEQATRSDALKQLMQNTKQFLDQQQTSTH